MIDKNILNVGPDPFGLKMKENIKFLQCAVLYLLVNVANIGLVTRLWLASLWVRVEHAII